MTESFRDYEFSDFPRVVLPAKINRRQFFRDMINDLRAMRAEKEAHPAYRLCDLGVMPDAQLAKIVPVLLPSSHIVSRDGFVWGITQGDGEPMRLFPEGIPAASALRRFDGIRTIINIVSELAMETGWEKDRTFAYIRGVFLWLVMARMVAPKDSKYE